MVVRGAKGITKAIRIYLLNVCTKFHGNPLLGYFSLDQSSGLTVIIKCD